jgi:hypothetical protein
MWDKWTRPYKIFNAPIANNYNPNIPPKPTILQKNPKIHGKKLKQKLGHTL